MSVAIKKVSVSTDWDLHIAEPNDLAPLQQQWRDLEKRSNCSFFQSWSWIGTWLGSFPAGQRPMVLEARLQGRLVGLAAIGRCRLRRGLFTCRALLVSETGDPIHDRLTVEHNGFLLERGLETDTLRECHRFFATDPVPWDKLVVSGLQANQAAMYIRIARESGFNYHTRFTEPYFYVDLEQLRRSGAGYLSVLSANTRHQIRGALRQYAKRGPLELNHARDAAEAREFFEDMCELHQRRWNSRGEPGAFSSPFMLDFHRRLIETCVPRGEIELVRLSAGCEHIGYLYQFIFRGVVYNYQGGFLYEDNAHLKPGLVAHSLAIEQKMKEGAQLYDFLMGDQRFKRSLAPGKGHMCSLILRRRRPLLKFKQGLKRLLRKIDV